MLIRRMGSLCLWGLVAVAGCGSSKDTASDETPGGREFCGNGIDDDGDGLIDCEDEDCGGPECDDGGGTVTTSDSDDVESQDLRIVAIDDGCTIGSPDGIRQCTVDDRRRIGCDLQDAAHVANLRVVNMNGDTTGGDLTGSCTTVPGAGAPLTVETPDGEFRQVLQDGDVVVPPEFDGLLPLLFSCSIREAFVANCNFELSVGEFGIGVPLTFRIEQTPEALINTDVTPTVTSDSATP